MSEPEPKPSERQPWEEAYQLAVLETDTERLRSRIETAKSAIALRLAEIQELPDVEGQARELDSLTKALNVLRLLAEHAPLRRKMVV